MTTGIVATAILGKLTRDVVHAGLSPSPLPWTFDFPADSSAIRWAQVRAVLTHALRAREATPRDTMWRSISIDEVSVTNTALWLRFTSSGSRRCSWRDVTGSSTSYIISLFWLRSGETPTVKPVLFSDGIGCNPTNDAPPPPVPLPRDSVRRVTPLPVRIPPSR